RGSLTGCGRERSGSRDRLSRRPRRSEPRHRDPAAAPGGEPAAVIWSAPFDELVVGDAFATRGRTVTEADVVGFAALTGDWHPQHADAVWARASAFGEWIAHGMLVISFAVGLVPFDPDRVVALRRIDDVVFKRPVALGDRSASKGRSARCASSTSRPGWSAGPEGRKPGRAPGLPRGRRCPVAT